MGDYDVAAQILANGVRPVDYLGAFNRGANLAQNTTNVYDSMQAKRQMINAMESGVPQELGAAQRMAQVRDPAYANSMYAAQNNQAVALGNRQQFNVADRSMVAQMALSARTPREKYQILQQEADEHDANGYDSTPIRMTMDRLAQGEDITPILQTLAQQGQQKQDLTALERNAALIKRMREQGDTQGLADVGNLQRKNTSVEMINGVPTLVDTNPFTGEKSVVGVAPNVAQTGSAITVKPLSSLESEAGAKQALANATETGTQTAQIEAITPKEIEKANAELVVEAPSMVADYQMFKGQTEDIKSVLKSAKDVASIWNTGFVGSLSSAVPGTPAADFANEIEIINANLALDSLAALKAASATGASGLGATNAAEFKALQSEVGALKQSTSKDSFIKNLERVEKRIDRYQANRDAIFNRTQQKYKMLTGKELVGDMEGLDQQYNVNQQENTPTSQQPTPVKVKVGNHSFTVKP